MTIEQITAERDRLRAFARKVAATNTLFADETALLKAWFDMRAAAEEALANTSPAPVESVNEKLLDLARNVGGSDDWFEACADLRKLRATLREFQAHARAAIAKADKV